QAGGEQAGGEQAGGLATIRVLDRGTGLPDEVLERIFDPFFTTKESGTGLGLTIAHRVADAYGGRLSAGNRPGGGAAFELALPMVNVRNDASDWSARQTTAA